MAEYIGRADLIKNLNKFAPEHYTALINQLITKQPTADVEKIKHGEWMPYYEEVEVYNSGGFTEMKQTGWICGKCKRKRSFTPYGTEKYCSECGAKIDGECK